MAFEVKVDINFPALDKIATLLCMNSDGIMEKAVAAFAAKAAPVIVEEEPVAEEPVAEAPVVEKKKRGRRSSMEKMAEAVKTEAEKVVEPVESVEPVEPVEPETEPVENGGAAAVITEEILTGKPFPEEPEPVAEAVSPAVEEQRAPVVSERDYTLAEISQACMKLRDKNPALLEQARGLFAKYGVSSIAGMKGQQDKMNGFALDLIALGAVI